MAQAMPFFTPKSLFAPEAPPTSENLIESSYIVMRAWLGCALFF